MRRSDVIHRVEHVLVHNMDIEPVLAAEAAHYIGKFGQRHGAFLRVNEHYHAEKILQGRAKALEEDELAVDELDAVAGGKSRCFFHGVADGAMGRRKESDSGFFYRLGYAYGRLFR